LGIGSGEEGKRTLGCGSVGLEGMWMGVIARSITRGAQRDIA
jgi:hypothetical protein